MEILLPFLAALLVGVGVFLTLSRTLIRLIVGLSMLTYGTNLSIFIAGSGTELAAPPLLDTAGPYADPLPQALILTAIVIGFATTALLLVLAVRAYQAARTDDVEELLSRSAADTSMAVYTDSEHPVAHTSITSGKANDSANEASTRR